MVVFLYVVVVLGEPVVIQDQFVQVVDRFAPKSITNYYVQWNTFLFALL